MKKTTIAALLLSIAIFAAASYGCIDRSAYRNNSYYTPIYLSVKPITLQDKQVENWEYLSPNDLEKSALEILGKLIGINSESAITLSSTINFKKAIDDEPLNNTIEENDNITQDAAETTQPIQEDIYIEITFTEAIILPLEQDNNSLKIETKTFKW